MRYFLTGATGFIGGHLARQLIDDGHEVVALVRSPEDAHDLRERGAELVKGDILEAGTLRGPMEGADRVFHVAGWYKVGASRGRDLGFRINVDGTRNTLEAARDVGVGKVVYTSTIAVYGHTGGVPVTEDYRMEGPWLSLYDESKWRAHYEVAEPMIEAGLPLVIVHPGLVHGLDDHSNVGMALRDYLRGRLPAIPNQGGCWCPVDDIARGHVLAMERGAVGEAYNLAGTCNKWKEALEVAHEITGIKPPGFVLPSWAARLASRLVRPLSAVVRLPSTYHPETLRVAAGTTYFADDTKARSELGWEPRPFREGLEITLKAEMAGLGVEPKV